jgi:hypothetical protein
MTAQYVYVVCRGEHGEGHDPVSVHADYDDAVASVAEEIGDRPIRVAAKHVYVVALYGCDEIWIYGMPVQGGAR